MTSRLLYAFTGIRAWVQSTTALIRCQELFSDINEEADEVSGCHEEVLVSNTRKDKQIQEQRG